MSLPRYGEYKDSGTDWLGEVPSHWQIAPLWTLFKRTKRTGFWDEQLLSVYRDFGVIPKASRDDNNNKPSDDLSIYQLVNIGDLAINKMKAWQGAVAISEHRGIVSPAYFIYESVHSESSRFLHYLFRAPRYITGYLSISKGIRVNQWDLEPQYHSRMPVLLPSKEEQTAIATFLDRETGKIDALVAEQEKLLRLLAEKRQAIISHAVTKGLNPDAPMKDSGVAWLGEVPEHWGVCALRRVVVTIEQGWSPECHAREAEENEWGVLKAGCLNGGVFRPSENKALPPELSPDINYEVHVGDVLMSRASGSPELVGSTALVSNTRSGLMLSDKIFRLRLQATMAPRYFVAALNSRALRVQIENALSGGNGMANNLPQSNLLSFLIPVPPNNEQDLIADFIEAEIGRLDNLKTESERAIALLKERRAALISAAVTGQIDVRGAVAG